MPDQPTFKRSVEAGFIICLIVAAGFILLGFLPENGLWGLNHLYFFPMYARIVFAAVAILALLPPTRKLITRVLSRLAGIPSQIGPVFTIIIPVVIFILFRVAVHSLGDGYQRSYEIERGVFYQPTEMLDFFIHALLYHLISVFTSIRAVTAMAATSIVAGMVFVFIMVRLAPFDGWKKIAFIMAVFSLGSSQFFFGYAESYTLLYLFTVWYLLLAFRSDEKAGRFGLLTVVYLLAGLSHQISVILLPSYLYLAHLKFRFHAKRFLMLPLVLTAALMPLLLPEVLNLIIGKVPIRKAADYFLPLIDKTYGLFSAVHFFDILNQLLLVSPLIMIMLPLLIIAFRRSRHKQFALTLILPSVLFLLLIDPKLTMARDWDLFAVPVGIGSIMSLYLIFNILPDNKTANVSGIMGPVMVSLILLCSWVLLNNHSAGHLQRAEYILDHAVKNKRYGYELLAYYYSTHEKYEDELRILTSIDPVDRTPRVYGKLSQALYTLGRLDEAYHHARLGVREGIPNKLNAVMAAVTSFDKKEYYETIFYLQVALDMDPDDFQWLYKLGDAYYYIDSLDAALKAYNKSFSFTTGVAYPFFGLANVYVSQENYERAEWACREGLRREPNSPEGNSLLKVILQYK